MAAYSVRRFLQPVVIAFSFAAGFFTCLWVKGLLQPSGWADALSGIATAVALLLAVVTYIGWHRQKVREDAYHTKKLYISCLVSIEAATVRITGTLFGLVPAAGMIVPSDAQAKSSLEKVLDDYNDLRHHSQSLIATCSELKFWGATLSKASTKEHTGIIIALEEYLTSVHYLHNSLVNVYIQKSEDNTVEGWKARFNDTSKNLGELFESRKSKSMNTVFDD
ncbi:hypothetical protein ACOYXF_08825 [Pseudomonas sp. Tul1A2]